MSKKRVFVSFDYDNDEFLKTALIGQAKNDDSPFELADHSIKEQLSGDWKEKAKARIKRTDLVIVMCGLNTNTASGVSAELKIAQEQEVPYFLLAGYAGKKCVKPVASLNSDKLYNWTWDNLKTLVGGGR
jgi:hypothetical protein